MTGAGVHPSPMYCDQENKIPRYKHGCRAPTSNVKSQVVLKEEWIGSQKTPQDMSCLQCALISADLLLKSELDASLERHFSDLCSNVL